MYINGSAYIMHYFWSWLFIDYLDFKMAGVALTSFISNFTIYILHVVYITYSSTKIKLPRYSKTAFKNWGSFLVTAIPIGSLFYIEWSTFEFLTLIAG